MQDKRRRASKGHVSSKGHFPKITRWRRWGRNISILYQKLPMHYPTNWISKMVQCIIYSFNYIKLQILSHELCHLILKCINIDIKMWSTIPQRTPLAKASSLLTTPTQRSHVWTFRQISPSPGASHSISGFQSKQKMRSDLPHSKEGWYVLLKLLYFRNFRIQGILFLT